MPGIMMIFLEIID